jgi:hypothetical protein
MLTEVQIVLPPCASDEVSVGLRQLTAALRGIGCNTDGGLFGGSDGYGANFENDTFMMHQFCWCEEGSCLWCSGCGCDKSDVRFFIDDIEVSSDESYRRNLEFLGPTPGDLHKHGTPEYEAYDREWYARVAERDRRWRTLYPAIVHTCERAAMFATRAEGSDEKPSFASTAPHFWHKASGMRVQWYKYIGRSMEIGMGSWPWPQVLADALGSITAKTTHAV